MMIQSDEKYFIDTNVLIYSSITGINYKANLKNEDILIRMKKISIKLMNRNIGNYFLSNQIINEYYAIMTNKNLFEKSLSKYEVLQNIKHFLIKINIVNSPCYDKTLEQFINKYDFIGKQIFDYYIYYTMLKNNIANIITFNVDHFKIFREINVCNPLDEKIDET